MLTDLKKRCQAFPSIANPIQIEQPTVQYKSYQVHFSWTWESRRCLGNASIAGWAQITWACIELDLLVNGHTLFQWGDHNLLVLSVQMHFAEAHPIAAKDPIRLWVRCTLGDIFTSVLLRQQIQHFDDWRDRYEMLDKQHLLFRIQLYITTPY